MNKKDVKKCPNCKSVNLNKKKYKNKILCEECKTIIGSNKNNVWYEYKINI